MPSPTCTLKNGSLSFCQPMEEALLCSDLSITLLDENTEAVILHNSEAILKVCPFCGVRILEVEINV